MSWKTFPKATDHFNVKFYFANACLNPLNIYIISFNKKIKRTDAWFQVSKRFVFSLSRLQNVLERNVCASLKDEKIYEYIFMSMF